MSNDFEHVYNEKESINAGKTIALLWSIDDIIFRGKDRGITISEDKAIEMLANIQRQHDAEIGVNWSVIDANIDMESPSIGIS